MAMLRWWSIILVLWFSSAQAVELMKWERIPLLIPLSVDHERVVFVDRNVRVGFPAALNGKLRVQSSGGAVYLQASEPFEQTRLQLQDVESGEIILLDITAKNDNKVLEPVRLVYSGDVSSVSEKGIQKGSSVSSGSSDAADNNKTAQKAPVYHAPLPVVLTRYAAQSLYAPLRTIEAVPGIHPVNLRLPSRLTTLYPSENVVVSPVGAWGIQDLNVVALKIRNRSSSKVILDARTLSGSFVSATFQHRWLGAVGTPEDTTTLYLVVRGRPENAFIAEPALLPAVKKGGQHAN
ncbi:TPA: TIGR03749 family integrating conjugative element protein [Salmonella enterica]|nr:TIGR03749 family integrating conjugative element protein [Salmonella enterica]EBM0610276.1 TIGR03749 family integrating conjugative element protein [Salmonella enterica]EJX6160092.1 TIGR03749 family integrating conjugative element protein [Salmonella enterica]EJX9789416.1 TIGR03749 family integrating conjugative element protein [Salmonella enterica]ELH0603428.1 TIGR03749 family integrating conjugative element protein [Salmonella enterica]